MQLQAARAKLTDSRERPSGDLKVTTTPGLGINWLIPRLGEFTALYPEIRISMMVTDEELDLSMARGRCRNPYRKPTQPDLIQRKLFSIGFHAYCSPEYAKRSGTPRTLDELDDHRLILLSDINLPPHLQNRNWLIEAGRNGSGRASRFSRSTTCSAWSVPASRVSASPRCRIIWSRRTAVWCNCSVRLIRFSSTLILCTRKS